MKVARRASVIVSLCAVLFGQSVSAKAAGVAAAVPSDPLTSLPLPLLAGERLVPLKGGCHQIVAPGLSTEDQAKLSRLQWLGACRFGLIHGSGFRVGADGKVPDTLEEASYGRMSPGRLYDEEIFPVTAYRDTHWTFSIYDTPQQALTAARNGPFAGFTESLDMDRGWIAPLAEIQQRRGNTFDKLKIDVWYRACPLPNDINKSLSAQQTIGVSAADAKLLAPVCDAAVARLKREQGVGSNKWLPFGSTKPFQDKDYGYYYSVYVFPFRALNGEESIQQITICPRPGDVVSCEQIWKPLVAPFLAIRDAERKRDAEFDRERQKMIAALEGAFAAKKKIIAEKAAAGGAR